MQGDLRPTILLTNDDGWNAAGLRAAATALESLGNVIVVAPQGQRSAVGHSITLHKPLRLWEEEPNVYVCSGSPVDCVYLGYHTVCQDDKPDLVVSGINRGPNLGNDIFYSGTVAGALEGLLLGLPAMAVSQQMDDTDELGNTLDPVVDYTAAAQLTVELAARILEHRLPTGTLLNVNVPPNYDLQRGARLATLGWRIYDHGAQKGVDPRGRPYYWIGGGNADYEPIPESDCLLLDQGHATVTPVRTDMTDRALMKTLEDWNLEHLGVSQCPKN